MARRRFTSKLERLAPDIVREVSRSLVAAGDMVRVEAQTMITAGAVSGKHHQPSAPGEAPNNDTGTLAGGIVITRPEPLRVLVTSTAPYSAALEFGSSRTAARPFLGPAANAKRRDVEKLVAEGAARAIRRAAKRNTSE